MLLGLSQLRKMRISLHRRDATVDTVCTCVTLRKHYVNNNRRALYRSAEQRFDCCRRPMGDESSYLSVRWMRFDASEPTKARAASEKHVNCIMSWIYRGAYRIMKVVHLPLLWTLKLKLKRLSRCWHTFENDWKKSNRAVSKILIGKISI